MMSSNRLCDRVSSVRPRWMSATLRSVPPQISFNYPGRFAVPDAEDWALVPDGGLSGASADVLPASRSLAGNAWTEDRTSGPQLHLSWQCPAGVLPGEAVHDLACLWFEALRALASYAGTSGGLS